MDEHGAFVRDENGEHVPEGEPLEFCEFRDLPPAGLTSSRTTEVTADSDETGRIALGPGGGPMLMDDPGDFVLSIEVPDHLALEREVHEDPPPGCRSASPG